MKIQVKVKAGSRKESLEKTGENNFIVKINQPAVEGKANKALIKILAEYFDVSPSRVSIVSGDKSKNKIIEIYPP